VSRAKKHGPGPSSVLITPDHAGNVVGVDPHKLTLTVTVVDPRGGIVASECFRVSGGGHRALEVWARQFGQIARWGVENAAGWGRHTAIFLIGRGHDVRDVCANRTPRQDRARQRGTQRVRRLGHGCSLTEAVVTNAPGSRQPTDCLRTHAATRAACDAVGVDDRRDGR
jgi:hypothetical protein